MTVSDECSSLKKMEFKCAWCEYSSSNFLLYTTHKKNHTNRIYECEYDCNESFETQQNLVDHVEQSHHDQLKSVKCVRCLMEFPLNILLYNHSLSHIRECEQCVCSECGKVLANRRLEERHRTVHLPKTVECSICPSKFKTKRELHRHMDVHSSETHTCNICNKVYKSYSSLKKHKGELQNYKHHSIIQINVIIYMYNYRRKTYTRPTIPMPIMSDALFRKIPSTKSYASSLR